MKINALKQQRIEAAKAHEALLAQHLAACEADERGFTDEEKAAQADAEAKVHGLDERIEAEQKRLDSEKRRAAAGASHTAAGSTPRTEVGEPNFTDDPAKGFRSPREFMLQAMAESGLRNKSQIRDERLKYVAAQDNRDTAAAGEVAYLLPAAFTPAGLRDPGGIGAPKATVGSDEQGIYDDRYGGFSVAPATLRPGVLQLGFEGDPTTGRTMMVPMQSPTVEMIARTDKNHTTSVSGGFTVTRRPEAVAATSSRQTIEMVTMRATSLFGLAYATEELLTDSVLSYMAVIEAGFRDQFAHQILKEKLRGTGASEYLGILTALSSSSLGPTLAVTRTTSSDIKAEDALNMRSRCWGYGRAIWIANHDTYPSLAKLSLAVGTGGQLIYQQSIREDRPDLLLGRPIFYSEYAATLGSAGDLILGVWSEFLEGVYQPLRSAESVHVRFVNHERTFKFWIRNAGAPWWRSALTPNQSSTTLSPFIIIAA